MTTSRFDIERKNPPGILDANIRTETLIPATGKDLNTDYHGQQVKNIGLTFWVETGQKFGDALVKYHITGGKLQTDFIVEMLKLKRIYIIK